MAKRTKKLLESNEISEEVRLNKYLSDAGVCSRREADKYIAEGKVTIDGITAVMGSKVKSGQKVMLAGKPVDKDETLVLIAFNKPRGIVCTTDKREKDNIIDFIQYGKRIYPIGRLDKESEGLILLTNDGNIVNKILRAGNNHEKEYIVTVNKAITSEFLKGMAAGVPILDTVTRPCEIKALDKVTFQIVLTQGLNRQIRRMCEYFGYKVLTLKRTRIMNINLGYMQVGGYRNVTEKEIGGLNELISNSVNTPDTLWNSMEDASDEEQEQKSKRTYKSIKAPNKNPVNKKTDYVKSDYKTLKNKKSDSKKIDSNKAEYKSTNSKSTNSKSTNSRSTNSKSTISKNLNYKSSNNKNTISESLNNKNSNNKNSNNKNSDYKNSDYKALGNKKSDTRTELKSKPAVKSTTGDNKNTENRKGQTKSGNMWTRTSDKSYKKFEKSPSRGRR